MPQLNIVIRNIDYVRQVFRTAPDRVRRELKDALYKSAILVQRNSRIEAPVDTGVLRSGIDIILDGLTATIAPRSKYAIYVHEGTGRYARGGNGRNNPWVYRGGNGTYHWTVGQRPNPFMERAADRSRVGVQQLFDLAVARMVGDA